MCVWGGGGGGEGCLQTHKPIMDGKNLVCMCEHTCLRQCMICLHVCSSRSSSSLGDPMQMIEH